MTRDEKNLLLTVGRLMRANATTLFIEHERLDREALNEALRPFDPMPGTPINDASVTSAAKGAIAPVDRTQTTLTDGSPVTADHREISPTTGQQKAYVVLSEEERAKGFVKPVRRSYIHEPCGALTTMGIALAETYARDPYFYSGTFCTGCAKHFPVGEDGEFVWSGTLEKVGT